MPAPTATCDVFVVIDQAGDYAVGNTADGARCRYEFEVGSLGNADGFRVVKLAVRVALPEMIELPEVEAVAHDGPQASLVA
jgi:hypothetical protein